ncbi:MAG: SPOR domain-containing protein [Alistipes sp.]|jgi:cell division protein FtsN|uniref:SPOR domain-containing protein n=1 Tax=Candidatus Cryptobacteroides bacterium TaxID=3085639 RepID=UPI0040289C1C|nr:SPOR domain-containing protein [Alistipes sp.]
MKNTFLTIAVMTLVATAVTGCDFFRRLAGRPDSEWIEAKAEAIRQEEEALRIRQDSLERARKAEADSLAAADSVRLANHRYRFCVILGSFSSKENAERYVEEIAAKGYKCELLTFRNSTAVGVCPTDDEAQAKKSLSELQRQDFCPNGAWILERKQ